MKITTDDIMTLRPCPDWPRERVAAVVGAGINPTEIARHPDIPVDDRRWVLSQLLAVRDLRALVSWACECAQDVRHLIADEAARDAVDCAIQTAIAWTEGAATAEDCRDAAHAAYAAAYAYADARAANYAAYAAAYAAYVAAGPAGPAGAAGTRPARAAAAAAYAAAADGVDAVAAAAQRHLETAARYLEAQP